MPGEHSSFGNLAIRSSDLTHGFASPLHSGFAFVVERFSACLAEAQVQRQQP